MDKQKLILNWLAENGVQTLEEIAQGLGLSKFAVCVVVDGLCRETENHIAFIEKTVKEVEVNGELQPAVAYKLK